MYEFAIYVVVGIVAQLIDGVLGMGYGVTAFDSIGGGGWGPIVVGTLLARGNEPRATIAPVAARLVNRVPARPLMIAVGAMVVVLSVRTIAQATG